MDFISVIIPTRNRRRLLARCLDSLAVQSLPRERFEVIVADSGSTDGTVDACRQFSGRFERLEYVPELAPGLHAARHAGFRAARGEILVFADDDIEAGPCWLEAVADAFSCERTALVGGKCLPRYEQPPPEWIETLWQENDLGRYLIELSLLDLGRERRSIPPRLVWGCNFSVRRNVLVRAGGFHPDGMPDPWLVFRGDGETAVSDAVGALRLDTIYEPAATVHHFVSAERMTFQYVYHRNFAQGISDSFSRLRGAGAAAWAEVEARGRRTPPARRRFQNAIAHVWRKLGGLALRSPQAQVRAAKARGYQQGFAFHQRAAVDRRLRDWILRADYWQADCRRYASPTAEDARSHEVRRCA